MTADVYLIVKSYQRILMTFLGKVAVWAEEQNPFRGCSRFRETLAFDHKATCSAL